MSESTATRSTASFTNDAPSAATAIAWLKEALATRRLAPSTIHRYLEIAAHFVAWWSRRHADLTGLSRVAVDAFLSVHLARCTCTHSCRRSVGENRAALLHLLRAMAIPTACESPRLPIDEEVERYRAYLRDVCGAAEATRIHRSRHVRAFLAAVFADQPVCHAAIRPASLTAFVTTCAQTRRPGSTGVITDGLRSYIRYLTLLGVCVDGLRESIPAVARWRLSSLPLHLQTSELQAFVQSFDRRRPRGRRDYAMALCLTTLGLRASEVAALRCGDLDWRAGTITIRETKTHRGRVLPLSARLGRALVSYLRVRPATDSDRVFVHLGVRNGESVATSVDRSAVRLGYRRAGLSAQYTGTHRLRHTAATRLIIAGASLKEVADVLGHAVLDSTALYTKVDLPRLRDVALPWVEVKR